MKKTVKVLNSLEDIHVRVDLLKDTFFKPEKMKYDQGYWYDRVVTFQLPATAVETKVNLFCVYIDWLQQSDLQTMPDIPVLMFKHRNPDIIKGVLTSSLRVKELDDVKRDKLIKDWNALIAHIEKHKDLI